MTGKSAMAWLQEENRKLKREISILEQKITRLKAKRKLEREWYLETFKLLRETISDVHALDVESEEDSHDQDRERD